MRIQTMSTAVFLANLLCAGASAGVIQISNNTSDSFMLYSHSIGDLFGSDVAPAFSTDELASVHSAMLAWGIDTGGKITILPVDTNHGLSFLTLIDEEFGGGDSGVDGILGLSSTGPDTMGFFINDESSDSWNLIEPPWLPSQTLGATFVWGSVDSGDAFAWTDLVYGDAISYAFEDLDGAGGAIDPESFQFVSWQNDGWEVVSTNGFKADGSSVFSGTVIPAPPAVVLIAATIFGHRRRRPTH